MLRRLSQRASSCRKYSSFTSTGRCRAGQICMAELRADEHSIVKSDRDVFYWQAMKHLAHMWMRRAAELTNIATDRGI